MKNHFMYLVIFLCLALVPSSRLYSQCLAAPTATCTNTEPLVTEGEVLNAGTTKWYYGPVATFNMLTLKGGTLVVCGNLTIDKFYMDSGKIFIQPGARFVIGNGEGAGLPLRGHCYFYNYGTLEVLRNLSLENGWASPARPNVIINASLASVFKMNNQYFVINNANSWFVNKGKAYFHGLITDPQAPVHSVCLGKASETVMTVLYNKVKNSYYAPEQFACVSVSEFSQLWDTLANENPYINLCLGLTHRLDSSCRPFGCKPSWGMANLFRGCVSCGSIHILPTRFSSFYAVQQPAGNKLYWQMANFGSTGLFYIERSSGGQAFKTITSFDAGKQNNTTGYAWFDTSVFAGTGYYRIKYVDPVSKFITYSPVEKVERKGPSSILIYPDPFTDRLFLSLPGNDPSVTVTITDLYGVRLNRQQLVCTGNKCQVRFPEQYPAGIYMLTIVAGEHTWRQKIVKQ